MHEGLGSVVTRGRLLAMGASVAALVLLASACINDGAWSAAPAPVVPVQALETRLNDVSCVTEDWCLAVGSMGAYPLAEVWDGSSWSVVPAPSLGTADNTQIESVDCSSPSSCVVRVLRTYPSPDLYDYAVAWDGAQWHELTGGSEGPYLEVVPIGCAPDGSCLVVDNGTAQTVAWDGDSATTFNDYPYEDVNAIHCFAADQCLAATSSSMWVWNGAEWSYPGGSEYYEIFSNGASSFSCFAPDDCIAVGTNLFETAATSATWDGSSWTEVALPDGVRSTGDLECVGPDGCLVPWSGTATSGMLAWMGDAWYQATPSPASSFSCVPQWCLGVNFVGTPAVPIAATYEWTNS